MQAILIQGLVALAVIMLVNRVDFLKKLILGTSV